MKNSYFIFVLILFWPILELNAQSADSLNTKIAFKKAIVPTVLIGVGLLLNNSQLEQNFQTALRDEVGNDFEFSIDDYAQYAPIAEMYLADIMGVKAKNHWFDQTKYLIISNIITSSITHGLKNLTLKTRPNGADFSFPSGHTTFAFTNATVVYNEFRQTAPVLAYSGYAFAITTASFRMINNKHWLSDVLVGAGIGILVTDLVYYLEPLKNFNPFKKAENITLIPYKNDENFGIYFSYKF